jgi:hypothetical protein
VTFALERMHPVLDPGREHRHRARLRRDQQQRAPAKPGSGNRFPPRADRGARDGRSFHGLASACRSRRNTRPTDDCPKGELELLASTSMWHTLLRAWSQQIKQSFRLATRKGTIRASGSTALEFPLTKRIAVPNSVRESASSTRLSGPSEYPEGNRRYRARQYNQFPHCLKIPGLDDAKVVSNGFAEGSSVTRFEGSGGGTGSRVPSNSRALYRAQRRWRREGKRNIVIKRQHRAQLRFRSAVSSYPSPGHCRPPKPDKQFRNFQSCRTLRRPE